MEKINRTFQSKESEILEIARIAINDHGILTILCRDTPNTPEVLLNFRSEEVRRLKNFLNKIDGC